VSTRGYRPSDDPDVEGDSEVHVAAYRGARDELGASIVARLASAADG
jgi:hypothetical protein